MTRALLSVIVLFLSVSAFGAGRELEAPVAGPSGESLGSSSTAFAGNRFLTVWQHFGGNDLFGIFSDSSGKRTSPESFPVLEAPRTQALQLIGLGDAYALFWRDQFGGVHHAEINLDGSVARTSRLPFNMLIPRAAWNGENFLLVGAMTASSSPEAILLDRRGNEVRRTGFPEQTYPQGIIALEDGSFFATASEGQNFRGLAISRVGQVIRNVLIEPVRRSGASGDEYAVNPAALPMAGGGVMVAYAVGQFAGLQQLKITVLSSSTVAESRVLVPARSYYSIDAIHLVKHQTSYGVYFRGSRGYENGTERWEMAAFRIDAEGRPLHPEPVIVARDLPFATTFSHASSGVLSLAVSSPLAGWQSQVLGYTLASPTAEIQAEVLSLAPSSQARVDVGGNANGFVAVWNDTVGGSPAVHAASVDETGQRKSAVTSFPGYFVGGKLASAPTDHLFIRRASGQIIASRITSEGRPLQDVVLSSSSNLSEAAAVWSGSGFLVVWSAGHQIFTTLLSGNGGEPVVQEGPLPSLPLRHVRQISKPLVAFDGRTALLVWNDEVRLGCEIPGYCDLISSGVMAMRLSPSGLALDPAPVVLTTQLSPLLAGGDMQFLMYTHQDRSARVITTGGSRIQVGDPTTVSAGSYTVEDLAWNGGGYLAALTAVHRYIGILELDSRGRAITSLRATPADGSVASVRIAASGQRHLIVGSVRRRLPGSRAHAFGDFEFHAAPPAPPTTEITAVRSEPGGETVVTWQPVANADGYAIDVFVDGLQYTTIIADGNDTSVETTYPAASTFRVRPFNAGGFFVPPIAQRRRSARP